MKKVCVLMTVYKNDDAKQLNESVGSILQQKGVDYFLAIGVDGAVPDIVNKVLKDYSLHDSVKVHYFSENRGLATTLNELISIYKSKYEFIARMDADDISFENRLKEQLDFFSRNNQVDVLGTGCIEFSNSELKEDCKYTKVKLLPESDSDLKKLIFTRSPFVHPSVMFRASVFKDDFIRYPTNLHLSEDLGLWCLLSKKEFVFANVPQPLIYFRLNDNTISRRRGFKKAVSELTPRLSIVSLNNFYLLFASVAIFFTRLLPARLLKALYRFR